MCPERMQANMQPTEPNLIAETYRNHISQLPRRFEKHYDFIDVNQDGVFLLGTSNMTGRIWSGSCWVFNDPNDPPDVEKCVAGMEFEAGIPVGKWFDGGSKMVIGSDSGALNLLSLTTMADVDKHYLSTLAIVSEHDDTVTTIDVTTDGDKILSGSMDMSIKFWDSESATCERTYDCAHAHTVTSVAFQPERSDTFISTSTDGDCLIWDTNLYKPASLVLNTDSGYTTCCWVNSKCIALGANCGTVSLVDLRMKSELDRIFCSKRPIHNMVYDSRTALLAVSVDDPIVRVYNCNDSLLTNIYECERHEDFVRGLTWKSPNQLYSCAWDSKILLHEIVDSSNVSESSSANVRTSAKSKDEDGDEK